MRDITRAERARQFMPFASLRGYYDFIREQERVKEPRREISEDQAEELSAALCSFSRGDIVRVKHFVSDHYEVTEGVLTEFDEVFHRMTIVCTRVRFDDIISAELLSPRSDITGI